MKISVAELTFLTSCFILAILPASSSRAQLTYSVTDLGSLDGGASSANDINDLGQVVGVSFLNGVRRAYVWQNGSMVPLPGLNPDRNSTASAINNLGQVAGHSIDISYQDKAVMWHNGALIELGDLPISDHMGATGLNDLTQIVGNVAALTGIPPFQTGRGFLWESGCQFACKSGH